MTFEIENLFISENSTLTDAMSQLTKTGKKTLFICDKNHTLKASLTDGDIRRWILTNGTLTARIKSIANYSPCFLSEEKRHEALYVLKKKLLDALPIVNDKKQIIDIIFPYVTSISAESKLKHIPVVIMAGGLGTRLYPYTKILPKPLIPIGDIPIIEHIINRFKIFGCSMFYIIVNHKKNMIKSYFNDIDKDYNITFIDEEKPLGTGGGLSLLKGMVRDTFIFSNCDILIQDDFSKAYELHCEKQNEITMICSLKNFTIPYGIVEIDSHGTLQSIKEKPSFSYFTNTGCYIVNKDILDNIPADIFIDFPTIIENEKKKGRLVGIYPISEDAWLDMGQLDSMEYMLEKLRK